MNSFFISYSWTNKKGQFGFGSCEITMDGDIDCYEEVEDIKEKLDQKTGFDCIVINWIKLS